MPSPRAKAVAVGHFTCPSPECGDPAIIRRKKNGVLYGFCGECGLFDYSLKRGQEFFLKHGVIWPDPGHPPADLPAWIRENRAWKRRPKWAGGTDEDAVADVTETPSGTACPSPSPVPLIPTAENGQSSDITAVEIRVPEPDKEDSVFDGGLF